MTTAYPGNVAVTDWQPPPLTDPRTALLRLATDRYRYDRSTVDAALARLIPAIPAGDRWDWLDQFNHLAGQLRDLDRVGSTDDARAVLEELGEGPWTGDVLTEARTRRDELSAEIDRLVGEAQ